MEREIKEQRVVNFENTFSFFCILAIVGSFINTFLPRGGANGRGACVQKVSSTRTRVCVFVCVYDGGGVRSTYTGRDDTNYFTYRCRCCRPSLCQGRRVPHNPTRPGLGRGSVPAWPVTHALGNVAAVPPLRSIR